MHRVMDKGDNSNVNMPKKVVAKAAKKGLQSAAQKVVHPPYLKTNIPAGEALPAPPLGPQLGAVSTVKMTFES